MSDIKTIENITSALQETFIPNLPPKVDIETANIMRHVIKASRALSALDSNAKRLPNQFILNSSLVLSEARDSSAIENIVTTNDLLYQSDITPEQNLDPTTKEVKNYNRALWVGMELIQKKPLSESIFVRLVQEIKQNTNGIRKTPGTVIRNVVTGQNVHVPPQSEAEIHEKISNLEHFLYDAQYTQIDPLIKMAVMHYQFEAIHPFNDGNGRTGRIVNILWLVQEKLLTYPILFLSRYYLEHRTEYYERLQAVTQNNDWEQWIIYILKSIEETAKYTSDLIEQILSAREFYKTELTKYFKKISSIELLDTIFASPYFRIENLLKNAPCTTRQTAAKHLNLLTKPYMRDDGKENQLLSVKRIGRENIYFNRLLFSILTNK